MKTIICPMPIKWNEIYEPLLAFYEKQKGIPKPPIPLILAGWVYSNDIEKSIRWKETISWVNDYYPEKSIINLNENEWYYGD